MKKNSTIQYILYIFGGYKNAPISFKKLNK